MDLYISCPFACNAKYVSVQDDFIRRWKKFKVSDSASPHVTDGWLCKCGCWTGSHVTIIFDNKKNMYVTSCDSDGNPCLTHRAVLKKESERIEEL